MTKIIKGKEEVVIISKSGTRTIMPTLEYAEQYANGLWKGGVKKIEVKTTYLVADKKLFKEELDSVKFSIVQLQSDKDNVGDANVIDFINNQLLGLYRRKNELERELELISKQ